MTTLTVRPWLLATCALLLVACEEPAQDRISGRDLGPVDPTGCLAVDAALPTGTVHHEVITAGVVPNALVVDDAGYAWIVSSGDNTIARYHVDDPRGTLEPAFVDLGTNRNPYDLTVDGERVYVTNLLAGTLAVVERATGRVLEEIAHEALIAPQDVVVAGELVIVAAAGFSGVAPKDVRVGHLVVFERSGDSLSVRAVVETAWSNPQFLYVEGDALYVVSSGTTHYDLARGLVMPTSPAGVERFSLAQLASEPQPAAEAAWLLGHEGIVGNAGPPARVGDVLWLGSGTSGVLFAIDTARGEVLHDASRPLRLWPDEGRNSLVVVFAVPSRAGVLLALDFNDDAAWLVDPSCGRPVSERIALGRRAEMLEGPRDVVFTAEGTAHVLMSLAGSVSTWVP